MNQDQANDIRAREAALQAWLGNKRSYHPNELPETINPPTNEERSQLEVFEFLRDKPDRYFLYVKPVDTLHNNAMVRVTTWTGDVLGTGRVGIEYRSGFGDKRRTIRFTAITGDNYVGVYYCGAGDYARVAKVRK